VKLVRRGHKLLSRTFRCKAEKYAKLRRKSWRVVTPVVYSDNNGLKSVKKAYLYRVYPTQEQATLLQQQLNVAREVYNACLLERREAYRMASVTLNYYAQANQLKDIRRDRADVAAVNFSMLQAICRRAQRAYENFFRRVKAGQPAGFPRFKSYLRFNSVTFPSYGDGCKLRDSRLYIQGVGLLKVKLHRPVGGPIKTVTLKRVGLRWYVVLACEVDIVPLPVTDQVVGIDLGLASFLMTDGGKSVEHPQPLRDAQARLRRAQRRLARKKRGSHRRTKQRRRVAGLHEKIANVRRDFQHQTAHKLVLACDVICHEGLAIKNMVRNHSLARSISDAAWGQFIAILVGKAEGAGRQTIAVHPRDTSQTCVCGELVPKDLSERWHHCSRCGLSLPRDQVSAMLIKTLGLERLANNNRLGSSRQAVTWPVGASVA
jgi:putative transposase